MPDVRSICVYCGSSPGTKAAYAEAAGDLGRLLAAQGIRLVYGGGAVGLMGILADAALEGGGEVVGVLPKGLFSREVGHAGLTELREVGSMHERKQHMFDLADAFVALPGGLGTLEELAEVATWAQLGIHEKPVVVIDVDSFWTPFLGFLDDLLARGFLAARSRRLVVRIGAVDELLPALRRYRPPPPEGELTPQEI